MSLSSHLRAKRARRPRWASPGLEALEDRTTPAHNSLATALPIPPASGLVEVLSSAGEVQFYSFRLDEPGRLTVRTRAQEPAALDTRTCLLNSYGGLLVLSDGESPTNRDDLITQHLLPGLYYLRVEGRAGQTGAYQLDTDFDRATPPTQPLPVNFDRAYPYGLGPPYQTTGDFNGDGHADLATANTYASDVSVLYGLGDGSFRPALNLPVGSFPYGIAAADFNRDGRLDLATANQFSSDVSILFGRPDGTFAADVRVTGGSFAWGLSAFDVNADGSPDLAIVNTRENTVSVLLGRGDGTFQPERRFAIGEGSNGVTTGDLNGDGHLDLVTANFNGSDVSLLPGNGDGTFQPEVRLAAGATPSNTVTVDLDQDGALDLAVANSGSDEVAVFWGPWAGSFADVTRLRTGVAPYNVVAVDLDGDGHLDLASANKQTSDVSVLRGRGGRQFDDQVRYQAGLQPWFVVTADFNEDGRPDLATTNAESHDVSILLGLGDGSLQQGATATRHGASNPQGMVARDFNEDGVLDLAATTYSGKDLFVFLGRGDGTFQERARFTVGTTPVQVLDGDFNGDGHVDLATINCDTGDISVLLGNGDGTFRDRVNYPGSASGEFGVVGDFNGDGRDDLLGSGQFATGISLILGRGDGTFGDRHVFAVDEAPAGGATGDFNEDGHLDLATTNYFSPAHDISVHLGRGDATFEAPSHLTVGEAPLSIVAGDFNEDGHLDLINTNVLAGSVSLQLGRGDGTFRPEVRFATGPSPDSLLARDLDGDGHLDLIVSNSGSEDVSILSGRGDGTFAEHRRFVVGDGATPRRGLAVADLNGDGQLDLALPQVFSNDITVLLGPGNGEFGPPRSFAVGLGPTALATGDFNDDGQLDLAAVNPSTNQVVVTPGAGDTTLLLPTASVAVGRAPTAVVQNDFNRDGRADLATANYASGDVSVLLGLGTGSFRQEARFAAGANPTDLVTADFNGDRRPDLAIANAGSNDVSVLLGQGDGTFLPEVRLPAGDLPQALATGDFDGDGQLDLAVGNYRSADVQLLLGRGDGTFRAGPRLAVGRAVGSLLARDLNGDGRLDLATANGPSNDVSVLLGRGAGAFAAAVHFAAGTDPQSLTSADFNGDGALDLATANSLSDDFTVLAGRGDGTFAAPVRVETGDYPVALVSGDFNRDGRADLALATHLATEPSIFPGMGTGTFLSPGTLSTSGHAAPVVVDWNGDGSPDVVVIERGGQLLLRLARPGAPGAFEPPVVLNPDGPGARDLALVQTAGGVRLAALDAFGSALTFYAPAAGGGVAVTAGPDVPGTLPVRVVSGDINGDGRDDLVVVASGSSEAFVYLGGKAGANTHDGFAAAPDYKLRVGSRPTDAALADLDGDGRQDVVVSNRLSGDVSLFLNKADRPFASAGRFRTGTGLSFVEARGHTTAARSVDGPTRVLAGNADSDALVEVIVLQSGSNNISVLDAMETGGLLNPASDRTFAAGLSPAAFVSGRFNADAHLDLAVLNGDGHVTVLLGDAAGRFTDAPQGSDRLSAGNAPSGIAARDLTGDGVLDLLVSNDFGDLLILPGNGDGTFRPYLRAGQNIALAVADLNGDGRQDFVFANEGLDRVAVDYGQARMDLVQDRTDGVLAPGAVRLADMNADGQLDLIVANSGANSVFVYLQIGGQFGQRQEFAVGTNPTGLATRDLTGDGLPELVVANEGSNDVSVLVGKIQDGGWTMTPGPRLNAGTGPVDVLVQEVNGDSLPDLIVANSQSNDVQVLPGVGGEFFDDRSPTNLPTNGSAPQQLFVGQFDGLAGLDLVTLNFRSNDLTLFSNFGPGRTFASGGDGPAAAATGDFNADGLDDLFIVHNGDGRLTLLLGERDGLSLSRAFALSGLLHPTDVAFAGGSEDLTFFVTDEGREAATPFVLTFLRPPSTPGAEGRTSPEVSQPQFTLFGPSFPEGLTIPSGGLGQGGEAVAVNGLAAAPSGGDLLLGRLLLPTGLLALFGIEGDGDWALEPEAEPSAEDASWLRFLMGLPETGPNAAPAEQPAPEALDDLFVAWPAATEHAFGVPGLADIARDLLSAKAAARGGEDSACTGRPVQEAAGEEDEGLAVAKFASSGVDEGAVERTGCVNGPGDHLEETEQVGLASRSLAMLVLGVAHGPRLRLARGWPTPATRMKERPSR